MRSFPALNTGLFIGYWVLRGSGSNPWWGGNEGIGGLMLQAWQWLVDKCNEDNVGYSQELRNEQTVNVITYYDCSSIIWYALLYGGFELDKNAWPFTTYTMGKILKKLGFQEIVIDSSFQLQKGDIVVVNSSSRHHTEMAYDDKHTMGAHSANRPLADQVSINDYEFENSQYQYAYRFPYSPSGDWIVKVGTGGSYYLSDEEQKNNVNIIWEYFKAQGWSKNAVAGLCGNMEQESTFNPGLEETGNESDGWGLVQWTPFSDLTKVLDVLYGSHSDWQDGTKQLSVLYAEYQETIGSASRGIERQWYESFPSVPTQYKMKWKDWAVSTETPEYLCMVFQYCYERPTTIHTERQEMARKWYEYLLTLD